MSNAADVIRPPGATHVEWFYGAPRYYKRTEYRHLNRVCEMWQNITKWFCWNYKTLRWEDVGSGFCDRNLKPIGSPAGLPVRKEKP